MIFLLEKNLVGANFLFNHNELQRNQLYIQLSITYAKSNVLLFQILPKKRYFKPFFQYLSLANS